MYRIVLSFLFLLLINLSYVDLHAYSHLFGDDNDYPFQKCNHDQHFRNGANISFFLAPKKIEFTKKPNFQYVEDKAFSKQLPYPAVRFLSHHYTNLPPPFFL